MPPSRLPLRFPRHELVPRHPHGVARQLLTPSSGDDQAWDGVNPLGRREVLAEMVLEGYRRPRHAGVVLGHGFLVAVEAHEHDLERLVLRLRFGVERRQLGGVLAAGPIYLLRQYDSRQAMKQRDKKQKAETTDDGIRKKKQTSWVLYVYTNQ